MVDTGKPNYIALYNQHFKKFVKMDWNHQAVFTEPGSSKTTQFQNLPQVMQDPAVQVQLQVT